MTGCLTGKSRSKVDKPDGKPDGKLFQSMWRASRWYTAKNGLTKTAMALNEELEAWLDTPIDEKRGVAEWKVGGKERERDARRQLSRKFTRVRALLSAHC